MSSNCSIILNIPLKSSIFAKNNSITEIVINDINQTLPIGTFDNAQELANLLSISGWKYTLAFNHIYILENTLVDFDQNKQSLITFADMTSFDFVIECCSPNDHGNNNNNNSNDNTNNGDSDSNLTEELLAIETPLTDCLYTGILDQNSQTFSFLQNIISRYYILIAKNSPHNIIKGPFAFNNQSEFITALQNLDATLVGNLMTIKCEGDQINQVYFLNDQMSVIASISLTVEKCCPEGFNNSSELMVRLGQDELAWVPVDCLPESQRDLNQEVCQLPVCQKYKCYLQWDLTNIFLNAQGNYPWKLSQIEILGQDLTSEYNSIQFSSIGELGEALIHLGWSQVLSGGSVFSFCVFRDTLPNHTNSNFTVVNNMHSVIYSGLISVECSTLDGQDLQLVMKVGNKGTFLGDPLKVFDSVSECSGLSYTCSAVVVAREIYNNLISNDDSLNNSPVWAFCEIKVGGQEQVVLTTQFATLDQMEAVLQNMGWEDVGTGVYTLSVTVGMASSQSYLKIRKIGSGANCGDVGGGDGSGVFMLNTSCIADCVPENENRVILTRDEFGKYCWQSPSCFKGGDMNIMLNHGLDEIPDCNINPQFTIEILLKSSLIALILDHFSSNGPFWINFYKIENTSDGMASGMGGCGGQAKEEVLKLIPGDVFNLESLVDCLVSGLGWELVSSVENANGTLSEARLSIVRRAPLITGICINREGQLGEGLPFDFLIPITSITNLICPGLSNQSQVLIRGPTGYCFVDIDCFMPIIPPQVDFDKAICDLPVCPEDKGDGEGFEFCVCVKLDPCDLTRLENNFGLLDNLFITGYKLIGGTDQPGELDIAVEPPQSIGNGTFSGFVSSFEELDWSLGAGNDVNNPPVQLKKTLNYQVNYVVINRIDGVDGIAPFPVLLSTSCSRIVNCPSLDPDNLTLIKKPDGSVCWTQICPLSGPKGEKGETGAGVAGPTGPIGEDAIIKLGVTGLNISVCENLCGEGDVHFGILPEPNNGITGFSGNVSISLEPLGNGFLSAQKPTPGDIQGGNCRGVKAVDWQMQRLNSSQVAGADWSVIGGGFANKISPSADDYSRCSFTVISGGYQNTISIDNSNNSLDHSFIGGGRNNMLTIENRNSSISGSGILVGTSNIITALGFNSNINNVNVSGGRDNRIATNIGTTGASMKYSNIGGGAGNIILINQGEGGLMEHCNISGGKYNIINVNGNATNASGSSINGGVQNRISIEGNVNTTQYSNIGGGSQNDISINGYLNFTNNSFIGGGANNSIYLAGTGNNSANTNILGGTNNSISARGNLNDLKFSSILGGCSNQLNIYNQSEASNVTIQGSKNFIGGFTGTNYSNFSNSTIGGGLGNAIIINEGLSNNNISGCGILSGIENLLQCTDNSYNSLITGCVIAGGVQNSLYVASPNSTMKLSFIGGGYRNSISVLGDRGSADSTVIAGGACNRLSLNGSNSDVSHCVISGGRDNLIGIDPDSQDIAPDNNAKHAVISGGYQNKILFQYNSSNSIFPNTVIGGGSFNTIFSRNQANIMDHSAILSGNANTIISDTNSLNAQIRSSVISGGRQNNILANNSNSEINYAHIGGGHKNSISAITSNSSASFSSIFGGYSNTITASSTIKYSLIAGGVNNSMKTKNSEDDVSFSSILGGKSNSIFSYDQYTSNRSAKYNTIIGGLDNKIGAKINDCLFSVINGGVSNKIYQSGHSVIAGGKLNNIFGGLNNNNPDFGNTISGGTSNSIGTTGTITPLKNNTISGGLKNKIPFANNSIIAGGTENTIDNVSNLNCGVFAGHNNLIRGLTSDNAIIGGHNNQINTTRNSIILGGEGLITNNYINNQVICGQFNTTLATQTSNTFISRNFVVGDGVSNSARNNSFSVDTNGDVRANSFITVSTADFAEYFESHDGAEIPIGTSVVIDPESGKIKPADQKDIPFGVISGTASLLGNSADCSWCGKFLRDDFGRLIYETINGVPHKKINPDYDPTLPYKPRKDRPEWNIVGLLGQIHILRGQPVAPGWIKLKDMPEKPCDLWLVK